MDYLRFILAVSGLVSFGLVLCHDVFDLETAVWLRNISFEPDTESHMNRQAYPSVNQILKNGTSDGDVPQQLLHPTDNLNVSVKCEDNTGQKGVCVYRTDCTSVPLRDKDESNNNRQEMCPDRSQVCCNNNHLSHPELTNKHATDNATEVNISIDIDNRTDGSYTVNKSNINISDTKTGRESTAREEEELLCVDSSGERGVCVFYYHCTSTASLVIKDSSAVIYSNRSSCPCALQVCCKQQDVKPLTLPSEQHEMADYDNITETDLTKPEEASEVNLDPAPIPNDPPCLTENGETGFCVIYYQCEFNTNLIIDDGTDLITLRANECANYLEVCCKEKKKNTTEMIPMEIYRPSDPKIQNVTGLGRNKGMSTAVSEPTSFLIKIVFFVLMLNI